MQAVTLECGAMRCELRPEFGGCIAGLWFDGMAVLRSGPGESIRSARQSANFPLVPFSNRIADARMHWKGRAWDLAPNFEPEPHAMHGLGWQRPWSLRACDATTASMVLSHRPDASWPFAFDCVQEFRLGPCSLRVLMTMTSRHSAPAPAGLGWHPYFVKRPGSRLEFAATGRWEIDAQSLPTRLSACEALSLDAGTIDINHCFVGWSGAAELRDDLLTTRVSSSMDRLIVSTNPAKDFIAIEPVSHVSNALGAVDGAGLGIVELAPGEAFSVHMDIDIAHTTGSSIG